MSERITGELRRKMDTLGWYDEDGSIVFTTGGLPASDVACLAIDAETFGELCEAIDSIHADLERENKELRHDVEMWRDRAEDMRMERDDYLKEHHTCPPVREDVKEGRRAGGNREGGAMEERVTERLRWLIADVNPCEIADQTLDQNLIGWSDGWRLAALMECDRIDAAVRERHAWAPESHYVMLPKDADGEPIHIGDVMDSKVDYLFDGKPFTVRGLVLCEDGWEVTDGRFGNRYKPDSLRHHHEPTVEDVLREFFSRYVTTKPKEEDDAILAEYAAKLRLAGDAE